MQSVREIAIQFFFIASIIATAGKSLLSQKHQLDRNLPARKSFNLLVVLSFELSRDISWQLCRRKFSMRRKFSNFTKSFRWHRGERGSSRNFICIPCKSTDFNPNPIVETKFVSLLFSIFCCNKVAAGMSVAPKIHEISVSNKQ